MCGNFGKLLWLMNPFILLSSSLCNINNVLPLSALVTVNWFWVFFLFILFIRCCSCYSDFNWVVFFLVVSFVCF
jgi:hypothetical protein